jgi:SAM-dependent methyltransferase
MPLALDLGVGRAAAARSSGARAVVGDAMHIPVQDSAMARVFALEVLEHVGDPERVLEECRRVLANDGALVVSVPTWWSEKVLNALTGGRYREGAGHIRVFRKRSLIQMLRRAGFRPFDAHRVYASWTLYWIVMALAGAVPDDSGDAHGAAGVARVLLRAASGLDNRVVRRFLIPPLDMLLGKSLVVYATPAASTPEKGPQ